LKSPPIQAVLLDVDGTLVDSNDAHAGAWVQAFAENGIAVPFDAVRRLIGMGGDKLMPRVSDVSEDTEQGRAIAERRSHIFKRDYLPQLRALCDASSLVNALKHLGLTVVAASSAQADELRSLLEIAGVRDLLDDKTSSDDADESKPAPDIVLAALKHADVPAERAVMIGDTPYDIEAAGRAGVRTIAFRSGGWADDNLRGALAIYDGPWDLLAHLDQSPLAQT
jgi:HAD superfamily hydrolase (TIGR01509 family)